MKISLNGRPLEVATEVTVADLVAQLGRDPAGRGVAVAVNGEVVPRAHWVQLRVAESDRVEILAAAQGG